MKKGSNKQTKIAQITAYRISYGSLMQTLATQIAFEKCGMSLELFRYEPAGKENFKRRLWKSVRHPSVIIDKAREYWSNCTHKGYLSTKKKRDNEFSNFLQKHIVCTEVIDSARQRDKRILDYQTVLSGSDQIWNPINFGEKFFTCEFVPDSINLITYASSFGTERIPDRQKEGTRRYLLRFAKISLRESSGKEIIKMLTGRKFPVVLDPTLLLCSNEWENYASIPDPIEGKYIFTYFLSKENEFRKRVSRFKEKTGMQIVTIPHVIQYVKEDMKYADILLSGCAPDKWIGAIKNADYICTDSYHGMIFSIIFKKQFIVMKRFKDGSCNSANTRIYEVLNKLGLESRLWNNDDIFLQMQQKIDYEKVEEKLRMHKEISYEYIKNILNGE